MKNRYDLHDKPHVFYRGTNNPHEPNLAATGRLGRSVNRENGKVEAGLSVADSFLGVYSLYKHFAIIYRVTGIPLEEKGSDGEILLDVETVRILL